MSLDVSEVFYSIQGEGVSIGTPCIFIRLSKCNLRCGSSTWVCDSRSVMAHSVDMTPLNLMNYIHDHYLHLMDLIADGRIHLVLTGGEPLMYGGALYEFVVLFRAKYSRAVVEIETNGTLVYHPLFMIADIITCSPKLANSGNSVKSRALCYDILNQYSEKTWLKFVVSSEKDCQEIENILRSAQLLGEFRHRVFLMPAAATDSVLADISPTVWELCKRHGFRFSPRLHITLFGSRTGV